MSRRSTSTSTRRRLRSANGTAGSRLDPRRRVRRRVAGESLVRRPVVQPRRGRDGMRVVPAGVRRVRLDRGGAVQPGACATGCWRWSGSGPTSPRSAGTPRGSPSPASRRVAVPCSRCWGWRPLSTSSRGSTACPERSATSPRRRRGVWPTLLAERAGVAPTLDGFRSVPEGRLLELQNALSASDEPVDPLARLASLTDGLTFGPVVDGDLLRRPTLESLRLGIGADKELVAGATEDEFPIGLDEDARHLDGLPAAAVLARAGSTTGTASAYLEAHQGSFDVAGRPGPAHRPGVPQSGAGHRRRAARRAYLALPVRVRLTDAGRRHPLHRRARSGSTAWTPTASRRWPGPQPPQALADETHGAAVAFVTRGDPGWPAYSRDRGEAMVFGDPSRVVADGVPRRAAAARLTALSRDGPRGGAARPR